MLFLDPGVQEAYNKEVKVTMQSVKFILQRWAQSRPLGLLVPPGIKRRCSDPLRQAENTMVE